MEENTVFKLTPNIVVTQVADEAIVAPVSESIAQMDRLISLNRTGADIVEGVRQGKSVGQIVDQLTEAYEVDNRDEVLADVRKFLATLEEKGLVVRK